MDFRTLGLAAVVALGVPLVGRAQVPLPPPAAPPPAPDDRAPLTPDSGELAAPPSPAELVAVAAPSPARRALGLGAALIPGLLVGGAGHWVVGEGETAEDLLWLKTAGFGVMTAAALPTLFTGASRRVAPWGVPLVGLGFSVFGLATLADAYGAVTGGTDGRIRRSEARFTGELVYVFIEDPQFAYHHFVAPSLAVRLGRTELAGRLDQATDDDNRKVQGRVRQRLWGAVAGRGEGGDDGSALDLRVALAWHRHGTEGFTVLTPELAFEGRYDLARIGRTLRGAFVVGELGWGWEVLGYDHLDEAFTDVFDLLLMRAGAGMYLGDGAGEVQLFYNHRRDDYAGGLSGSGIGVGIFGHAGARAEVAVFDDVRITGEVRVGSAWVASLGLKWLYGEVGR